jgi:hypothetical protein
LKHSHIQGVGELRTGAIPTTGSPDAPTTTMHPTLGQLAAIMASTDGVPRVVRQANAVFLVSPQGAVWRIFDSDDATGESRYPPGTNPFARSRVFMGSGPTPALKIYAFRVDEPRSVGAERLHEQLLAADS